MTNSIQLKQKLNLIQLLRGLASLLVVFYHVTTSSKETYNFNFLGGFFMFGRAGVDIFFVLSGFIITYTNLHLIKEGASLISFLKKRFIRIFPIYWIFISFFLSLQIFLPSFYHSFFKLSFENIASTYFLLPRHIMLNGVSWTLSFELFFYSLFSLAFLLRKKMILLIASFTFIAIIIILSVFNVKEVDSNNWINLFFSPMILEFFMGILAALIISNIPTKIAIPFIIFGTVSFIFSGIFEDYLISYKLKALDNVIYFGIPSLFLIIGIVKLETIKNIHVPKFFVSLGEASYSLYLMHIPIVVGFMRVLKSKMNVNEIILQIIFLILILFICRISIYIFEWIEKPLGKYLNKII